ncbi:low affinity immunoglobulin gamma Fc region receptor III-A-like isoform X3 [Amphiprion ocellaris]|uniref:low affinity immunoglobulin gamma Fc region receptor III-A-like isoform X3 n=1 Tax=Amphiprion ocellaris TaxID=80972 RepID=UPI0024112126|nr:low affinity immunoglobulin gamma Fc region receptor III-A-like isoform X3 [Amphiprion ocellaris]XP_023147988.2 low affinity immunoglobulin gamma Fc region receptor III-A-like isoform X3 [Amphiprion ocellaris]XP_054863451.1 low affinity immunoglobulin gamma Fc region receptor III-A-like isoform X3 [Amphiprion ocellaris]XP_054863452.1 low affinity immunoglobulin gamma Fc region receptor III-A-like isoform X3 [Amphiprion ocellaris]
MEATTLCIGLLMIMLLLPVAQVQDEYDAQEAAVILEGPRSPVLEGDTVTLLCRNRMPFFNLTADFYKDDILINSSNTGSMIIDSVSKSDEGLYKCNIYGAGESQESWLVVKVGVVILESPIHPVTEGDSVTLRCRKSKTLAKYVADFYRRGFHFATGYNGETTIQSVSKSDQGPYKCKFSGIGESSENWLEVKVIPVVLESPDLPVMEGEDLMLHCKNKVTANITADFYKDGRFIGSSSTGNMSIHSVSKSHQGQYKCNILGAGESQDRWLSVRECPASSSQVPVLIYLLIKTVCTSLSATLLLLLLGKYHRWKHGGD